MTEPTLNVLFRVAAGPQVGFGHLARSRSLARALGVVMRVSIRGSLRTKAIANSLGWTVIDESDSVELGELHPDLIVVDDPLQAEAEKWVKKARRIGVPVASVHDLGLAIVESDLVIDGSIAPVAKTVNAPALRGPAYAILDPSIAQLRADGRHEVADRVLIALGGGAQVFPLAGKLSRALMTRLPAIDIHVASGFVPPSQLPTLPRGQWISSPSGLGEELSEAAVAVVAGGVTLYEACALRVPVVAMPVTAAQHVATRAFACRGAAVDCGWPIDDRSIDRVADAVVALFANPRLRKRISRAAGVLIDGNGVSRVAAELQQLASTGRFVPATPRTTSEEAIHAA